MSQVTLEQQQFLLTSEDSIKFNIKKMCGNGSKTRFSYPNLTEHEFVLLVSVPTPKPAAKHREKRDAGAPRLVGEKGTSCAVAP